MAARQADVDIGNARIFRHDESYGSQYGRHDHPSRRGNRFYRSSLVGRIAGLFHEGDGENAGGDHIGDGTAGHVPSARC